MVVSIIAAMADNRVIGKEGKIPWDVPADRRRFRELTFGHPVIMGRRTFETLPGPLAGRANIVVTRNPSWRADGVLVAHSLAEALLLAGGVDEAFVIGGGEIYRQALTFAQRIYLTVVHINVEGDTKFPELPDAVVEVSREQLSDAPSAELVRYERRQC
ncbi:MAG: dihydrofolate reductase [Geobacter sp.]|nr:dihydrofolate reductase [Geobacter sp.]